MSRLLISAAHKSSGKTTVSIGIAAALAASGKVVQSFKKGPDYIDPQWLALATGRNCYNLDFYTMSHEEILATLINRALGSDFTLIEGNKGLYDGLDIDGSNSNAALARLAQTPVVLVLDARGMTRGIAPLILGYQAFDPSIRIMGVILNQLGGSRHESKLRRVIEHYTDVEVVGAIHNDSRFDISERHLGLVPGSEDPDALAKIRRLREAIEDQVNLDRLIDIAGMAAELAAPEVSRDIPKHRQQDVTIGIIQNAAFNFYYPDDLESLEAAGARLVTIDTMTAQSLPAIDGLFIGGGFPEQHMQALSHNRSMRKAIREAIDNGLPAYAECGGLMYLSRSIHWGRQHYDMVGIIPADISMESKPQGRGYVQILETEQGLWPERSDNVLSAHEFHYSHFINLDKNARFAYKVMRGTAIDGEHDGYIYKNLLACYTHQRNTVNNPWTRRFVEFIRQNK